MLELFWEMHQQSRINDARRQVEQTEVTANEARRRIDDLEHRIDRLAMITAAMWHMLKVRNQLTDDQLANEIQRIDLSDGRLDGRVKFDAPMCPKCNRAVSPRHQRCVYCGETIRSSNAFSPVL